VIEYTVKVYPNSSKEWYLNGKFHREDGPAIERPNGSKFWYLNGQLHREDGPAVEWSNGSKEWFLNGKRLTEEEHKAALNPTVEMTMEEICKALGKNVKVVK
jgi:antitoxin component YwqK of YwqJK toxin-antitoxin module